MQRLRVANFGLSLDGFGAGLEQSLDNPLGVGGRGIFEWFFATRTFQAMHGGEGGETGVDNEVADAGFNNVGAWILGRNMFGPVRGPWLDESWRGWWGDEPVYHTPVFVLTHHAREPLVMLGGTTFHFITGGIHAALEQAFQAANGKDVRVGGGVSTIRQYLQAGLIHELKLASSPAVLGQGESLFTGLDLPALGYSVTAHRMGERATHVTITKGEA